MTAASGTVTESVQPRLASRALHIGRGCLIVLALVAGCCAIVGAGFYALTLQCRSEIRSLAPWPGAGTSARSVATVDLGHLGLEVIRVLDPEAVYGSGWASTDAAVVEYGAGSSRVATFGALRYSDVQDAREHFTALAAWSQESCSLAWWSSQDTYGVIGCDHAGGHNRMLWNDRWILDVDASSYGGLEDLALVDEIRDAAAAQWQGR